MSVVSGSLLARVLAPAGIAALAWSLLAGALPMLLAVLAVAASVGVFFVQWRNGVSQTLPCMELMERIAVGGGSLQAVRVGNRVHLLLTSGREVKPLDVMSTAEFVAASPAAGPEVPSAAAGHPQAPAADRALRRSASVEEALRDRLCLSLRSPFAGGGER